ncbi:hypothetical protein [Glycomyces sp. NPDC021274]|uniref:hypothetical protein n=1 Tax=Glycomyces sp. NPDC021274 TaxID=3155120 RepID=UPI0033EDD833
MKQPRVKFLAAVAAAVGVALSAGCSDDAKEVDVEGLRAAYLHNLEQVYELELIQARLYRTCMESLGWTEHAFTDPPAQDEYNGFWEFNPRPSVEEAKEVGYSRSYLFGRQPELVNTPQWDMEETSAYYDDLGGEGYADLLFDPASQPDTFPGAEPDQEVLFEREYPEGGCIGEVVRELYGSHDELRDYLDLEYAATSVAPVAAAMEDERVLDVQVEWSVCMESAGYVYDRPIDAELAVMQFRLRDADPEAGEFVYATAISPEEAEQAYADAVCNEEVGLDETRFDVLWEYMDQFVADHEVDYHAFSDAVERYQERAGDLLAEGRW